MKEAAGDEGGCRDGGTQEDKRIHLLDHRHWNFIISSYKVENAPIPPHSQSQITGGHGMPTCGVRGLYGTLPTGREAGPGLSSPADAEVQSPGISPQMDSPMKDRSWSSEQESGSIAPAVPSRGRIHTLETKRQQGHGAPALDEHSGQRMPTLAPLPWPLSPALDVITSFSSPIPLLCFLTP